MNAADDDVLDRLDPTHRRKALLYRAVLACVLMLLLVTGLTLFDSPTSDEVQPPGQDRVLAPPAPTLAPDGRLAFESPQLLESRPAVLADLADAEPPVDEEAGLEVAEGEGRGVDEEAPVAGREAEDGASHAQAESVPVAPQTETPAATTTSSTPASSPSPPPARPSAASPSPAPTRAQAPPRPAPSANRTTYQVRLGDFTNSDDARRLVAELLAAGHPAGLQWRVTAGPYPSRAAATEASRTLERNHRQRGLVVQLAAGSHGVQLGVFGDADNADGFQRQVRAWGYPVVRDARVVIGPFADRGLADALAGELGRARGLPTVVIALGGR